jgi:hypothetical protein
MGRAFIDRPLDQPWTASQFVAWARQLGFDSAAWPHQCHAASLQMVLLVGEGRVARGSCPGVPGQHSWVVLGGDCYDRRAPIIDPTLWSYDPRVDGIATGKASDRPHTPHGSGSIFDWGKPGTYGGPTIELDVEWSGDARRFLDLLGPLDRRGWADLAHAPVGGWPAREIITAMHGDDRLAALVPIDIVGMVTDLNPSGLYLPDPKEH